VPADLERRCRAVVAELGLAADVLSVEPLTGGVASDIAVVTLPGRRVCVKFALPRLKVAEEWRAPVHRNRAEYAWLAAAGAIVPGSAPQLLGRSERHGGFAMEYIDEEEGAYLWKPALLEARADRGEARAVGDTLGRIHAASTARDFDARPFRNMDDFHALRIEPYLLFTAARHPALAQRLRALAGALRDDSRALVHGDVSPKNIVIRGGAPVFLDAECATMGDPAFDVAFCLNHLCLKALHVRPIRGRLLGDVGRLWRAYAGRVGWEAPAALEARVAALVPALMLARVDGKSPVEYLDTADRARVRKVAGALLASPPPTIAALTGTLAAHYEGA